MSNKIDVETLIKRNSFRLGEYRHEMAVETLIVCDSPKSFDEWKYAFYFTSSTLYSRTSSTEEQLSKQFELLYKYFGIHGSMEFLETDVRYHIFVEMDDKHSLTRYIDFKRDTRGSTICLFVKDALAFFTLANGLLDEYIRWCNTNGYLFENALIVPSPKPELLETTQWNINGKDKNT